MSTHTELLTWHRLPGQMPDAELTVLLSVEDDGDSTVAQGYWDGEAFRWCDTGGEVAGAVLGWADQPAGLVGVPVEPTFAMVEAGSAHAKNLGEQWLSPASLRISYAAHWMPMPAPPAATTKEAP